MGTTIRSNPVHPLNRRAVMISAVIPVLILALFTPMWHFVQMRAPLSLASPAAWLTGFGSALVVAVVAISWSFAIALQAARRRGEATNDTWLAGFWVGAIVSTILIVIVFVVSFA
jgi:hypothetical protein